MQVRELSERSTGTPKVDDSDIGSLVGRSVAFVLLSAVEADEDDSVPAGLHSGRYGNHATRDHTGHVTLPLGKPVRRPLLYTPAKNGILLSCTAWEYSLKHARCSRHDFACLALHGLPPFHSHTMMDCAPIPERSAAQMQLHACCIRHTLTVQGD